MRYGKRIFTGALLCGVAAAGLLAAQMPEVPKDKVSEKPAPKSDAGTKPESTPKDKAVEKPGKEETPRDPTEPSRELIEAMRSPTKPGETPATPAAAAQPVFALKARVIARGKPPTAIIEVDGKMFIVGKDSMFQAGGRLFRVTDVSAEAVRLEVDASKVTFTLR